MGLITALSLNGAGWHPQAWRAADAAPRQLLAAQRYLELIRGAETAGVDFVTVPDSLDAKTSGLTAGLDAVGVLSNVASQTSRIGLVPGVTTTHTEPFHLQAAIATLDFVSQGRAGLLPAPSLSSSAAAHIGRRQPPTEMAGWQETAEVIDVSRRLWDSWQDDAEIRDVASGRFIDRNRLHYSDFVGTNFSIKGPSIVPRSPQGHPVTVIAVDGPASIPAAALADVVLIRSVDSAELSVAATQIRHHAAGIGRDPVNLRFFADLSVLVGPLHDVARNHPEVAARARWQRLAARTESSADDGSGSVDFVGTVESLVDLIAQCADVVDGVHLRPATIPTDWNYLIDGLLPALRQQRLLAPQPVEPTTLRERLGLARPINQYLSKGA